MSAFGPMQTSVVAAHMSAFGGKADMTLGRCPLFAVAIQSDSGSPSTAGLKRYDTHPEPRGRI
jgi:hypothetical protein